MKRIWLLILFTVFTVFTMLTSAVGQMTTPPTSVEKAYFPVLNELKNPGFELGKTGWTLSTGTLTVVTAAANIDYGGARSVSWDASASSQTLTSGSVSITSGGGYSAVNMVASCRFKAASGTATHTIQGYDGTNVLGSRTITSSTSGFVRTSVNFVAPASGTVSLRVVSNADEPTLYVDNCYLGVAEGYNLGTISQAKVFGTLRYSSITNCMWTVAGGGYSTPSADTDCSAPTVTGNASAPTTKIPAIRFQNGMPPGDYIFIASGEFAATRTATSADLYLRFYDGTNASNKTYLLSYGSTSSATQAYAHSTFVGRISYSTAQGDTTINLQTGASGTAQIIADGVDFEIMVLYFPSAADQGYRPDGIPPAPTVQRFTSGSGTYTTPTSPKPSYIRVRMVGGGGGGSGSGTTAGSAATAGGNTTFGSSLLTANGGAVGSRRGEGGAGGTVTVNSPASTVVAVTGGEGAAGAHNTTGAAVLDAGASGGSSFFGGAASGGANGAAGPGNDAYANTGSGGGGGLCGAAADCQWGSGGGAGGYVEAIISNPSASYSYAVGAGGTAGGAGTSGYAGGAGGSGVIIVEEYYGQVPFPLITNSVTTSSMGQERTERIEYVCGASSSITKQSGSWVSAVGNYSVGACALTFATGMFTDRPVCVGSTGVAGESILVFTSLSSTGVTVRCNTDAGGNCTTGYTAYVQCQGPR